MDYCFESRFNQRMWTDRIGSKVVKTCPPIFFGGLCSLQHRPQMMPAQSSMDSGITVEPCELALRSHCFELDGCTGCTEWF